jgi:para-nitrobenzyl esterase
MVTHQVNDTGRTTSFLSLLLYSRVLQTRSSALAAFAGVVLAAGAQGGCSSSSSKGSPSSDDGGGATTSPSTPDCNATVSQGAMNGKKSGGTCEYLGIPYAQPPTGNLRFMPPEPAGAFTTSPLDATAFGASCPQTMSLLSEGIGTPSEDCLSVNVFTPENAPAAPLPVMVFIYGGGFNSGSSSLYNGVPLSEKGPAVVVTLNYRLGALGFLALPELDAQRGGKPSGSDGIRDQQLALQWVQDNIAVFHGDPTNVTVFGESAGSLSTCIHLVSPGSQGLAKRYIMESVACVGNGEAIYSQQQAYTVGAALVSSLCDDAGAGAAGDAEDVLTCLRAQSTANIIAWEPAAGTIPESPTAQLLGTILGPPFTPTVEGQGGVLPDTPANLIAQGKIDTSADIIAGTNLNEFGLFTDIASLTGEAPQIEISTAAGLDQGLTTAFGANASAVEQQYQPITDANAQQVLINIVTDYAFRCPMRQLGQMVQAKGLSNFYLYSYEVGKAWHSFELEPLFDETALAVLGDTPPSAAFTQTMLGYWTQFAATGNPNGAGDGGAPSWPTNVLTGSDQYLQFVDPTPDAMAHLAQANCEFWANFAPLGAGSTPDGGSTSEAGASGTVDAGVSDAAVAILTGRRIP